MHRIRKLLPYIFFAGVALSIWSVVIEPASFRIREYPVYVAGWPKELSGYSVAFVSDTHVGSLHITLDHMQKIIDKTNAREPDLVLLGGDYVIQGVLLGKHVDSDKIIALLSKFRGKNGLYAVLGNHDWWEGGPRMLKEFNAAHVPMLEDSATYIKAGKKGFWLVGVSDYWDGVHDVKKALSAVRGNDPVLLFTHSPDIYPEVPQRVGLTMAGHTHGGQVYVPLLGRPIVPSKYGQRYVRGLITEDGKQIFVGSGIGTSIIPVRFLTPPEVSILKIYPRKDDTENPTP